MDNSIILPDKYYLEKLNLGAKPNSSRCWSRDLKKIYLNRCFITSLPLDISDSHHIYNKKTYPNLSLSLFNGIVLTKEIHKNFHKLYGQTTTPAQFVDYIKKINNFYPDLKISDEKKLILINWLQYLINELDQELNE